MALIPPIRAVDIPNMHPYIHIGKYIQSCLHVNTFLANAFRHLYRLVRTEPVQDR